MPRFPTVLAFLLPFACSAQIDPAKLDSLTSVMEAKNQSLQAWQDSFRKRQDSIYKHHTSRTGQGLSNDKKAIAKERQVRQKRRLIFRILGGIILLSLLITAFIGRRNKRTG